MKTRFLITLCTAMIIVASLIAAPVTAIGKSGEKTPIKDSWVMAKTKIALAADSRVKGRQISVKT
jgi:hypothetical protein